MSELSKRLKSLAMKKTRPFCYHCYHDAPMSPWEINGSVCPTCGSDDHMRMLEGVGCEYGTDWVVDHLVKENVDELNVEEMFDDSIRESYGETAKVGWLDLDVVNVIKTMDPVSYRVGFADYCSSLEEDDAVISFDGGNTYYSVSSLEEYLDKEGV